MQNYKYNTIFKELQNRVDSGEITLEFAESVNDLAYERYVIESDNPKEFRYVIDKSNGHFIKVVYDYDKNNITSRKDEPTNYTSKGNKIVALVDMCNNKRLSHVDGYPPIHNSGGSIEPLTVKKYMGIMKRFITDEDKLSKIYDDIKKECPTGIAPNPGYKFSIENSIKKGQNHISYKVGNTDNTDTFKTTKPNHTLGMFNIPKSKKERN